MKTNTTCGLDDITTHDERLNDVQIYQFKTKNNNLTSNFRD